MKVARWNALRELNGISERLNRLFSKSDPPAAHPNEEMIAPDWCPSVDVTETDEAFEVKAELPELKKEDVRITLKNGVLTLQGERKQESANNGRRMHRVERSYGRFFRSFTVPDTIDGSGVKATFKDGVLHFHLPKIQKVKPIEVQAA